MGVMPETHITINSDMGEGLGLHSFGQDEDLMEIVDVANVACGFHAGDPAVLDRTLANAAVQDVRVGAHPGLPDITGFGRRRMALLPDEAEQLILYQVGALTGFLRKHALELNHIKPHGALYGMLAGDEELMRAAVKVNQLYGVPFYGLAGTAHETICAEAGVEFVPELYVDLNYGGAGNLVIERKPHITDPASAAERVRAAMEGKPFPSTEGTEVSVEFASICVHSDASNSRDVAAAVRAVLSESSA